jgi:hypothetical protein
LRSVLRIAKQRRQIAQRQIRLLIKNRKKKKKNFFPKNFLITKRETKDTEIDTQKKSILKMKKKEDIFLNSISSTKISNHPNHTIISSLVVYLWQVQHACCGLSHHSGRAPQPAQDAEYAGLTRSVLAREKKRSTRKHLEKGRVGVND